jgi:hypothetical protein
MRGSLVDLIGGSESGSQLVPVELVVRQPVKPPDHQRAS